ncbi:UBA/THIF-type NAD/FAD binding protein [Oleiphilus messinensis]|uniref:UBA/THIF-type NAD/FAD binding protein n=1 Tax=Oleiphilus messinensis TaxID=141451 RepID=A0A1Y0II71_9GAMM|nr:ThiF family adenylyltransferase [Oleiphilus messinensis]ARU59215.1 UBA/THIF-type NAD/FAD binding protein [Oleiphilus messinensis]
MSSANKRFNRQIAIFGLQGQEKIQSTKVVLVGFGGLGTFVLPQLCLLGVRDIAVVEHETFSETNRNRYMGFLHSDFDDDKGTGFDKVMVAERVAKGIDPEVNIKLIKNKLESRDAFDAIKRADIVVGCLDSDGARSILNELSIAYDVTYIDLASEVFVDGTFGGRIAVVKEGNGCLHCMGYGLDQTEVRRYLADETQLENEAKVYGVDKESLAAGSGPSVVDLNGIIASLGVQEFKLHITDPKNSSRYLNYRGHLKSITKVQVDEDNGCYCCSLYNKKLDANVERYLGVKAKPKD